MRASISGSARAIERIHPILAGIGVELAGAKGLSNGEPKMIEPDLILVDMNSEELADICSNPSSVPVYLLVDGHSIDWSRLSELDVRGYIYLNVGDNLLKAYLEAITRRITPCL